MNEIMKHGLPMLEKVFGPSLVGKYVRCGRRGSEYDIIIAMSGQRG